MRRLFCLAAAGFLLLSGTAAAATPPPPRDPDPPVDKPIWPRAPYPTEPVPIVPGPVRPIGVKPPGRVRALVLTFAYGERVAPVVRHALLMCDPPRGTHPAAVEACEALIPVHGDPGALTPLPGVVCTTQYDPVTVTATGTWDGRFIRFEHTYGNACTLYAETGSVFSFRER
ncbi:SSI family serine proteinase inhibitor [Streptosporangium sp. NPDC051022]|uniref:SSI family serine proteinase inhibitor n=1 Tax=Streptosporangium sp. NPDC051022 TaxID=3155752 RepID=UPI0034326CDC